MPDPVTPQPPRIALEFAGKVTVQDQQGNPVTVVIQKVGRKFGNGRMIGSTKQVQVRRHVATIKDRMSGPQLIRRARFTAAVQAWQGLSATERDGWKRCAKRHGKTGYNLFLSRYLRYNTVPTLPSD